MNRIATIQHYLNLIDPRWRIEKPQSEDDLDDQCIFQNPAEGKEARASLPRRWFDAGRFLSIEREIRRAIEAAG
jgi:hypothetical protein